jgi:ElaB/YqjD/DUF883 family membrane-anchored ribosome-binding protein
MGSLEQVLEQGADTTDADAKRQRAKIEEVLAFTRLFDAVAEQLLAAGPDALGTLSSGR